MRAKGGVGWGGVGVGMKGGYREVERRLWCDAKPRGKLNRRTFTGGVIDIPTAYRRI